MRRPHGFGFISSPDGKTEEFETATCAHCNCLYRIDRKSDNGGFCRCCMDLLCGPCADKGTCTPFAKQVERMEAKERFLSSAGLEP